MMALGLNITLNYFLIIFLLKISPIWAIGGVAIATLISNYFYLIYMGVISNKKFGIIFKKEYIIKPLIASLVMFFILVLIRDFIKDMNLFTGILEIVLGVLIYFGVIVLIKGLKKEDYSLFSQVLKLKSLKPSNIK